MDSIGSRAGPCETLDRLAADALGGAVGSAQLGMIGLDLLQFVESRSNSRSEISGWAST